jgi:hypothetical protein
MPNRGPLVPVALFCLIACGGSSATAPRGDAGVVNPPAPVILGLPGSGRLTLGAEAAATIEDAFGATPSWIVENGSILSGQGTTAIRFVAGTSGTQLALTAQLSNSAGSSSTRRVLDLVRGAQAPVVHAQMFALTGTPGATATADRPVSWSVSGAQITSAAEAGFLTWTAAAPGAVSITASVANEAGGTSSTTVVATVADAGMQVFAGVPGGLGFADGPAGESRMLSPHGLVSDGDGGVYIADYNTVRHFDGGEIRTVAGHLTGPAGCSGQGTDAGLPMVSGIAQDEAGHLYVSGGDGTICKVEPDGTVSPFASLGAPLDGLTYGAGRLAAVHDHGLVTQVALDGSVGDTLGVANLIQGWDVQGIAALPDGGIVISGLMSVTPRQAVLATVGPGSTTQFFGSETPWPSTSYCGSALLCMPEGLVSRPDGSLLVADFGKFTLSRWDGATMRVIAGIPNQPGHDDGDVSTATLGQIQALALDRTGGTWIADNSDGLLRKLDGPGTTVTTLAGVPSGAGSGQGAGVEARLRLPSAIAAGPDGTVYVAEFGGRIVRASPAGVVSTLAQVTAPTHLVVGPGGNLLVSCGDGKIRSISPTGAVSDFAGDGVVGYAEGSAASARFGRFAVSSIQVTENVAGGALAFDGVDTVYVADAGNLKVRAIRDGVVSTFTALADQPEGVAVRGGDVYILAGRTRVERWSGGARIAVIPIDYVALGSLAVDAAGALYITQQWPPEVTFIPEGGPGATLVGKRDVLAVKAGPLPASVAAPVSVAVSPPGAANAGAVFVADFADNTVLQIRR